MKEVDSSSNMDSIQSLQTSEVSVLAEKHHVQIHASEQGPVSDDPSLQKENDAQNTGLPEKPEQEHAVDSSTNELDSVRNDSSDTAPTVEDKTELPVDLVGNSSADAGRSSTASIENQQYVKPAPSLPRSDPLSPKGITLILATTVTSLTE